MQTASLDMRHPKEETGGAFNQTPDSLVAAPNRQACDVSSTHQSRMALILTNNEYYNSIGMAAILISKECCAC